LEQLVVRGFDGLSCCWAGAGGGLLVGPGGRVGLAVHDLARSAWIWTSKWSFETPGCGGIDLACREISQLDCAKRLAREVL
jgi:hypothetical protein